MKACLRNGHGPAAGPAFADEAECARRLKSVQVSVDARLMSYSVDSSQPSRSLTAQENKPPGQRVLGRTVTKFRNKANYEMSVLELPGGRLGVRPSVRVEASFALTVVYVASEFPPASCGYGFILGHERRHIALHERQLWELAWHIRADLLQLLGNGVMMFGDIGEATREITASARRVMRERVVLARASAKGRHAEIDSAEEVSRLSDLRRLCAGTTAPTD